MIYVPVDVNGPIQVKKSINVQMGLTNNFPEIVFELHDGKQYIDLGDNCNLSAVVENTDLETTVFSGTLDILNPHRGQIICTPVYSDFTLTGINTLSIICDTGDFTYSFQTTIFVQSSYSFINKEKQYERWSC